MYHWEVINNVIKVIQMTLLQLVVMILEGLQNNPLIYTT